MCSHAEAAATVTATRAVVMATGEATGAVVTEAPAAAVGELVVVTAEMATRAVTREGAAAGRAARR